MKPALSGDMPRVACNIATVNLRSKIRVIEAKVPVDIERAARNDYRCVVQLRKETDYHGCDHKPGGDENRCGETLGARKCDLFLRCE